MEDPVEHAKYQDLVYTNSYASWETVNEMTQEECKAFLLGMSRMFKENSSRADLARKVFAMSETQAKNILESLEKY